MQVVGDEVLEGVLSKWRGGGRKRLLLLMLRQAAMPLLYGSGTGGRRGLWEPPKIGDISVLFLGQIWARCWA